MLHETGLRFESWREASAEFTCRANQGGAAQVSRVMSSVNSSDVPTHRCPDQVEGSLIQTDTLHKLHGETQIERGVNSTSLRRVYPSASPAVVKVTV